MELEFRRPHEDELRETLGSAVTAFGDQLRDEDFERHRGIFELDRILAVYDGGSPVGLTLSVPFELTTPGGFVPSAGVTYVGVTPTHRRRGILTELMRRQLEDVRSRGEPTAILWASEASIYGRFGYGIAAPVASMEAERDGFVLRDDRGPSGLVRLVTEEQARELFPAIHERVRRARPGMISRSQTWWELQRLPDPEHFRQGWGAKFYAVLELDDELAGYAMYRVKIDWERGLPQGEVRVLEALATTPAGERELWRFLFAIDLTGKVTAFPFDPVSPLFLMVVDPRRLRLTLADGLWLRLVDVEEALRRRTYDGDDPVVIDVLDALCPWNQGGLRVGGGVERTDDTPDLRLAVADLGSAYLGAFSFSELARAGRVEELRLGGLERADRLFRSALTPWCAEVF